MDYSKKMEQKSEASTTPPSLLLLNECCLLGIFEFLELDDLINLAACCSRLKLASNRLFKEYSKLLLDVELLQKGELYINRIFSQIGEHVSSLRIDCDKRPLNLKEIINKCKHLKCLRIDKWVPAENSPTTNSFYRVERLTLFKCDFNLEKNFLRSFHELEFINVVCSEIEPNELRTVFQNNPNIKSLFYWSSFDSSYDFNCQLLNLIPNVDSLRIDVDDIGHISELNSLLKLDRLRRLTLHCNGANLNHFLSKLARNGILEEMELIDINTDDKFFDVLTSFDKLQLLIIAPSGDCRKLKSAIAWPTKLKLLRLSFFILKRKYFLSMIEQLIDLESIDLRQCWIANGSEIYFNNLPQLSRLILNINGHGDRKRLDVVWPNSLSSARLDRSKEYLVDTERLRILNWSRKHNPLRICIYFPGCN